MVNCQNFQKTFLSQSEKLGGHRYPPRSEISVMVYFVMGMILVNSCSVHYGMVQWSGDEPSMRSDPFEAAVERIYQPPMTILLHHGEVPYVVILISQRSSNSAKFLFARCPLEPAITSQS
jgi:hypothetical protein